MDEETIHSWLSRIHFGEYATNFIQSGYDMPTISRMTPEDLTAIGITKPGIRRILKNEIQKLSIHDGIPNYKPNTLLDWLKLLRLEEYFNILCQQGYDSVDRVCELAWEDLEEVGINKLGHQKKIMLAIKKINSLNNNMNRSSSSDASNSLSLPMMYSNTGSCPDIISNRPQSNSFHLPVQPQYQDTVPIKMFASTKSTPSPTTDKPPIAPQLRTFQQLPINGFMFQRQRSEGPYNGIAHNDGQHSVFQSSRGRSLESLDNSESNYYQMYVAKQQRHSFNMFPHLKQSQFSETVLNNRGEHDSTHGYETDSELMNSYANNKRSLYEVDGTATLHRPKGLIKAKPIAKIVAKTRQTENSSLDIMFCDEQQKPNSFDKRFNNSSPQSETNQQNVYLNGENEPNNYFQDITSQFYSSLKLKKTPPPPPKRVNSMRKVGTEKSTKSWPLYPGPVVSSYNSSPVHHSPHHQSYHEFNEQVFASCVKSLASRFSINSDESNNTTTDTSLDEFPPPPSPLLSQYQSKKEFKKDVTERECVSSSSSTESMPFAHDNIGTIKQRVSNESVNREPHSPSPSFSSTSSASSSINSPLTAIPSNISNYMINKDCFNKVSGDKNPFITNCLPIKQINRQSPIKSPDKKLNIICAEVPNPMLADPLDDIETMLVNLSNQLDSMLENDKHKN